MMMTAMMMMMVVVILPVPWNGAQLAGCSDPCDIINRVRWPRVSRMFSGADDQEVLATRPKDTPVDVQVNTRI